MKNEFDNGLIKISLSDHFCLDINNLIMSYIDYGLTNQNHTTRALSRKKETIYGIKN